MGWLFAVALGLQRGSRKAVWSALGPLAIGHAVAMLLTIGAAAAIGVVLPPSTLKWGVAGLLVALGVYRLVRSRHIVYGGMQVNSRELATWSFLMATAHGAGLMVLPLVVSMAFFLIADIDSPRGGLIKVSPQNLSSLEQSIRAR